MSRTFTVIQLVLALIVALTLSFGAYKVRMFFVERTHAQELKNQKAELEKQCNDEKELTHNVEQNYQTQLSHLNKQLADAKRLPNYCVPITTSQTCGNNAGPPQGKLRNQNGRGLDRDWLIDYAGDAEKVRQQLIGCQKFVNDVWELKGQK